MVVVAAAWDNPSSFFIEPRYFAERPRHLALCLSATPRRPSSDHPSGPHFSTGLFRGMRASLRFSTALLKRVSRRLMLNGTHDGLSASLDVEVLHDHSRIAVESHCYHWDTMADSKALSLPDRRTGQRNV